MLFRSNFELYYPKEGHDFYSKEQLKTSPYSCTPEFINWLNLRHQANCRVGALTVYPKSLTHIRDIIVETLFS